MSRDEVMTGGRGGGSHLRRLLLPLARAAGWAARCDPMRFSALAAVVSLVAVAGGGCGSVIAVPDQGVVILGCHDPSFCYRTDCDCKRDSVVTATGGDMGSAYCNTGCNGDDQLCECRLSIDVNNGAGGTTSVLVQCEETAQLCVGRGPLCPGANAYCAASHGATPGACNGVGDPPQNVPVPVFGPEEDGGSIPVLEQHCQFADDVCCYGASIQDASVSD
jgi:hypothetical protein